MQRPPLYVVGLTLYGSIGLTLLAFLAGLLARGLSGSSPALAAARLLLLAAAFIAWLYVWRRLTLWARSRACRARATNARDIGETPGARRHSG